MSVIENSPAENVITSGRALTRFLSGSSSIGKGEAARISITLSALMAVISAVLVPSRMLLSTGPTDDSSVFAYIGWAMHRGLMPYRDIWDHKGPLLYYLQFAGISLHPASTLGIGLLELLAWAFAFFLVYRVIASFASYRMSLGIAFLSCVFATRFAQGGNLTESWALLPLAAAHYATWRWSQRMSLRWCAAVLGICFACIFWLRPNMSVYPLIAISIMVFKIRRHEGLSPAARQFAFAGAAALGFTIVVLTPLYRWGVFPDFVGAYFGYNAAYSAALSVSMRLLHTQQLLTQLFAAGIAILGTAGWVFALKKPREEHSIILSIPRSYRRTLILSLPLEIAAVSLSGRDYLHYVLPLLPTFAVLAACFLCELEGVAKSNLGRRALAFALLMGLCPFALASYLGEVSHSLEAPAPEYVQIIRFIQRATSPKDKIIVIGGVEAAYVTYSTQRLPASRYVYQYSLTDAANPAAADQRRQFLCDLVSNRPAVIVSGDALLGVLCASAADCNQRNVGPPVSDFGYDSRLIPHLLRGIVGSQYRPFDDPRFGKIRVFVRNDVAIPPQW
jgi:hypothetical protein